MLIILVNVLSSLCYDYFTPDLDKLSTRTGSIPERRMKFMGEGFRMASWDEFYGPNFGYVLELYERYRQDPKRVDPNLRAFFDANPPPPDLSGSTVPDSQAESAPQTTAAPGLDPSKVAAALTLVQSIRWYGHWASPLDPLGSPPPGEPVLHLETYGLTEADLRAMPAELVGGVAGQRSANAWEAVQYLRQIYSGPIGHDYLQIRNPEERAWLREAAESGRYLPAQDPIDPVDLLKRLTQVETFEHFLQRSFTGKTRFSIEGLDMLVPLLDIVIASAARSGIQNILIGMAHRGRLNVLAQVLQKPIDQILAEFQDPLQRRVLQNEPDGWSGDVKYHAGASRTFDPDESHDMVQITIQMPPNPSHLEAINPVVEGMARAAGTCANQAGPPIFDSTITLPILIHGDAAFPGQGVVAETLNFYRLPGYRTGGTIHIIANNRIGFTTGPDEYRSTLFAADLAKGYRIPIIHANADDPEAVVTAARIAFAYREHFQNDFMINLVGYRRFGHNEGDEPAFTQPVLYEAIEKHPSVRKLWGEKLVQQGLIDPDLPDRLYRQEMEALQSALDRLDPETYPEKRPPAPPPGAARKVTTAVPADRLRRHNRELLVFPEGFTVHPRLARILQRREKMLADYDWPGVDWATAEALSFATILEDGVPIRLTGQDVERGTFSHRHAVLHDAHTGAIHIPLQSLPGAQAAFEVRNSPLSEYAALGFEFGYNLQAPERLVIWEAQYGDFINNAQTIVDEFIVSARDKWAQFSSLVLLLPHGYEGQGPDHSSGRLERFLSLAAENNLRVVNCTTAANYFHLLRRQAALLEKDPLPLVVMTPKSLLRHPLVTSPLKEFVEGGWRPVIDRSGPPAQPGQETPRLAPAESIHRLILCSGKVAVDLLTSDLQPKFPQVGVARLEQLAPFPTEDVRALLAGYPALESLVWAQEEPENMGACNFVTPHLRDLTAESGVRFEIAARPPSASPAEGSTNLHTYNQRRLVEQAYGDQPARLPGPKQPGPKKIPAEN
jgi:2-oxoglutarate dehydrogenase E1 component